MSEQKYCSKCEQTTVHVRQNSGGEVATKAVLAFVTLGMSIGATPTMYECAKCGKETEG